jgi:hypothetical protein
MASGMGGGRRLWARLRARWAASGAVATMAVVPLALLLVGASGLPGRRVELASGTAWLPTAANGLATLIDGAAAQVVGAVRVPGARPGADLSVVQAGSSAYVVNQSAGTVSWIDGRTYEVSAPVQFGVPGGHLTVVAGNSVLYVVDSARRTASLVDPATLRVRDRLALAAQPAAGQSIVDDIDGVGRLWVLDSRRGGLTWFAGGVKRARPELGDAQSRLVLVQGRPVLVDVTGRRLGWLTDSGTVPEWSCLEIRAGDSAELLGSTVSPNIYAVIPATGALVAAGVDDDDCSVSVDIGKPGDKLGQPVESGQLVVVPNRTSGRVVVVDTDARRAVADLPVTKPGARLELVEKDGKIFYHDLDGPDAGVLEFDGQRWAKKAFRKYNPTDIVDGILGGAGDKPDKPGGRNDREDPQRGETDNPDSSGPDRSGPNRDNPDSQDPDSLDPNNQGNGQGQGPQDLPDPGGDPGSGGPGADPPPLPQPPVVQDINIVPDQVVRGQEATFTAVASNTGVDATWHWLIVNRATGETIREATTPNTMRTTLDVDVTPTELQIRLDVANPVGGAAPTFVKDFTSTSETSPQVDSVTANPAAAGIGQTIRFSAVEGATGGRGSWTWTFSGPGGPITPVTTGADETVSRAFNTPGSYTVTLTATFDQATDEQSTSFTVSNRAQLAAVGGSSIDVRDNSGTAQVQLTGAFAPQTVTVSTANWLTPSQSSIPVQPDGDGTATATVNLSVTGTVPIEGENPGSITFRLSSTGDSVTYSALGNRPPIITEINCESISDTNVEFHVHSPEGATFTLHVGGEEFFMPAHSFPDITLVQMRKSSLPNVSTWSIVADDGFLTTERSAARGACW